MAGSKKLTIAATEAGGHYGNLSLALVWGPEGALLDAEVACAVEDGGGLGTEDRRGHGKGLAGVAGGGGLCSEAVVVTLIVCGSTGLAEDGEEAADGEVERDRRGVI